MYLNYKFYITILKDAYGCWSLTVHGCVNIHILEAVISQRTCAQGLYYLFTMCIFTQPCTVRLQQP